MTRGARHKTSALHSCDLVGRAGLFPREHDAQFSGANLVVWSSAQSRENLKLRQGNIGGALKPLLHGGVQLTRSEAQRSKQRDVRSDLLVHALRVDECLPLTKGKSGVCAL